MRSPPIWARVAAAGIAILLAWFTIRSFGASKTDHDPDPARTTRIETPDSPTISAPVDAERMAIEPSRPVDSEPLGVRDDSPIAFLEPTPGAIHLLVTVLDARTKSPVPSADVRVAGSFEFGVESAPEDEATTVTAQTGAQGRASVALPAPGQIAVTAFHGDDYGEGRVDAFAPGDYEVTVELAPSGRVQGIVLDDASGRPVVGAHVSTYARDSLGQEPLITDANGLFELGPWPFDVVTGLTVRTEGYGFELVKLGVRSNKKWTIPARFGVPKIEGEGVPSVVVRLVPEQVILGRVLDSSGAPVVGARVTACGMFLVMENTGRRDERAVTTVADGRFRIEGLRSDIQHEVLAEGPGLGAISRRVRAREVLADLGDLRLYPPTSVRGTLVGPLGLPVQGARVTVLCAANSIGAPPVLDPEGGANIVRDAFSESLVVAEREEFTDAAGQFRIVGIRVGPARVLVELAGRERLQQPQNLVVGVNDLGVLTLKDETSQLSGSIAGLRTAHARIEVAEPGSGLIARVDTDEQGRFAIAGLELGTAYVARVTADAEPDSPAEVRRFAFVNEGVPLRWRW